MEDQLNNNTIFLEGIVTSGLLFSHEVFCEKFYLFTLAVQRRSDKIDSIQITVSDKVLEDAAVEFGEELTVTGQLRSYNKFVDGRNKLMLTVFARKISQTEQKSEDPNQIDLEGYICKKPTFRMTPFGREITDLLIAVNRPYHKSDYIPVIAWGRNAHFVNSLAIGEKVKIHGRFQSREYQKNLSETQTEIKIAYEVSVSEVVRLDDDDCDEPDMAVMKALG